MADEMRAKKISRREALKLAQDYAAEIAANYSHVFIAIMARLLTWFWTRLYDGVELHHFDQLQKAADGNEIVYVPCHRSHIDYLLLSYAIYYKGYAVPHVAAGINLNMPVLGRFIRKGGGFYIRRSFKGNTLYTMVFMKYLGLMMARGHSIEFFIEGGRSRTGRLLQPKTGMLSMTLRSYLRDPRRPVVFVPVYFGYERLVEGKTYIGELSGEPKEKESVFTLLRTLPALRKKFGKVHVSFGEPVRLDEILQRHAPDGSRQSEKDDRPPWLAPAVDDLASRIMTNINSAACVAPMNLIALVAARHAEAVDARRPTWCGSWSCTPRCCGRHRTRRWCGSRKPTALSVVRHGERMGVLQRHKHPLGDVLQMTEENSVLMTYFRNNVLHLMALPSLVACCFLNNRTMRTEDIQRLMWRIYPYMHDELFLRWREDEVCGCRARNARRHGQSRPARIRRRRYAVAAAADRLDRSRAAVGAGARHGADHRALLPGDRGAAQVRQRAHQSGRARIAMPADGAAHVAAVPAELAGVLRQGAVQEFHRPAARSQRARRERRRAAHVHGHAAGGR